MLVMDMEWDDTAASCGGNRSRTARVADSTVTACHTRGMELTFMLALLTCNAFNTDATVVGDDALAVSRAAEVEA